MAKKVLLPKQPAAISKKRQKVRTRPQPKELAYDEAMAAFISADAGNWSEAEIEAVGEGDDQRTDPLGLGPIAGGHRGA